MSAGGGGDRGLRNSRADSSYVLRFSFKFLSICVKIPESRYPSSPGTQVTQGLTSATEGLGHETKPRGRSRVTQCLTSLLALCHLQASVREHGDQGAAAGISGGSHSASRAVSAKISLGCVPAVSLSPLATTLAPW